MTTINQFLHFTSWKLDSLNPEAVYDTSHWSASHYWDNHLKGAFVKQGKLIPQELDFLRSIRIGRDGETATLVDLLTPFLEHLKYASELFKEFIFEQIRTKTFPELPSRLRCMYLFPGECAPDEYATNIGFKLDQLNLIQIFPVEGQHKLHVGDLKLLNCNMNKYDKICEYAQQYWAGSSERNINTEILFEGKFKVRSMPLSCS